MPNLQVREVPAAVYGALSEAAREEHRSLAQQTLITLERGLGMTEGPRERRRRILESVRETAPMNAEMLPSPVDLVREDRQR